VSTGKKFREFINAGAYLDVKPNDDIIDILGFLAFEVVRELCVGAVALKQSLEEESAHIKRLTDGSKGRKNFVENGNGEVTSITAGTTEEDETHQNGRGAADIAETNIDTNAIEAAPNKGSLTEGASSSTAMKRKNTSTSLNGTSSNKRSNNNNSNKREASPSITSTCGLFAMPPAKASPLMTSHVREAFARLQRNRSALSTASGGVPGGLKRTRVFVI
jgi:transcription initiation protein SPT3